jgi:hypothetical protein
MDEKKKTPASRWASDGRVDPHGKRYDCEREDLIGGDMTDDEAANHVGMTGRDDLDFEARLSVGKDRIRWLSRKLVAAEAELATLKARDNAPVCEG